MALNSAVSQVCDFALLRQMSYNPAAVFQSLMLPSLLQVVSEGCVCVYWQVYSISESSWHSMCMKARDTET